MVLLIERAELETGLLDPGQRVYLWVGLDAWDDHVNRRNFLRVVLKVRNSGLLSYVITKSSPDGRRLRDHETP